MKTYLSFINIALVLTLLTPLQGHSESCVELNKKEVEVRWTAFKTPAKIGVSGVLKKIILKGPTQAKTIEELLQKTSFRLMTDKTSLNSQNPARDAKIAKVFFSTLANKGEISGDIQKLTKKKKMLNLNLNLNGVKKTLPLRLTIKDNTVTAYGFIDILDYSMGKQLAALNKACFAKHEGKTWSDVEVQLTASFKECSK
jgi:hypothetical protein